jgi:D-glycero-alpha-D-manno-heptose 1-phosphate guanylyltransferase
MDLAMWTRIKKKPEAVILAGGLGTRLKPVVAEIPKPMAPIAGKPFLCYLFELLKRYQFDKVILATGYKHEKIFEYFQTKYKDIDIEYSVEDQPLGTGGAIKKAFERSTSDDVLLLNGDTLFNVNIGQLSLQHKLASPGLTIALKPMSHFSRYGNVLVDPESRVVGFEEKKSVISGYINGGVYRIKPSVFNSYNFPLKFSFETDFLEKYAGELLIHAFISDSYFIDIGIPEDYQKAQIELPKLIGE